MTQELRYNFEYFDEKEKEGGEGEWLWADWNAKKLR